MSHYIAFFYLSICFSKNIELVLLLKDLVIFFYYPPTRLQGQGQAKGHMILNISLRKYYK